MAIDLLSLQLNRAYISKAESTKYTSTKNSADKIKNDVKTTNAQDILELSGKNVEDLPNGELTKGVGSYSSDVFFSKNMPEETDNDGNYVIGHVKFSKTELEQCRQVLKTAADSIEAGIGKGWNLDYKNYAQMSISTRIVEIYGENHLSKEQAKVISNAMRDYNDALISLQDEILSDDDYISLDDEYYWKKHILSDGEIDFIKGLNANTSIKKGYATKVQTATNEELINKIKDVFSKLDIKDSMKISSAMQQYQTLMSPVYTAFNGGHSGGTMNMINSDISGFMSQISKLSSSMTYRSMNLFA